MPIILEGERPNMYADAVTLIGALPQQAQNARESRGLTIKQAAAQIGIGDTTLASFEAGSNCTKSTLLAVLGWLANLA